MAMLATLLAQEAAPNNAAPAGPFGNPMFLIVLMGIFFFTMLWMPARKQRKEQAAMLAAIKPGSKILTSSGIIGTITRVKDGEDEVVIRSEDAKLKITRTSIIKVLGMEEETK